jgi:lysozyme
MTRILLLGLCLALAACGGPRRGTEPVRPAADAASGVIRPPNFDDTAPHPGVAAIPRRYPVHGVDMSRFQGAVDWPRAHANGVNFAFLKATEGGDAVDPLFRYHWNGAAQAGVARGAYHVFYHCRPAIEQARWFISHVPRDPGALPPVLDIEWTPTSPTCRIRRDPAEIRAEARIFLTAIARHFGKRPVVYTTLDFYHDNDLGQLTGADFWLRSVAAPLHDAYPGQHWTFWQYTSTGLVPGITGPVDLNVFAGSAQDWQTWRTRR